MTREKLRVAILRIKRKRDILKWSQDETYPSFLSNCVYETIDKKLEENTLQFNDIKSNQTIQVDIPTGMNTSILNQICDDILALGYDVEIIENKIIISWDNQL